MYVGAHIAREKTLVQTLAIIQHAGGNALQIFVGNPRSGRASARAKAAYLAEAGEVRAFLSAHGMLLIVHSAYTFNFARPMTGDPARDYWVTGVLQEVEIAEALGAAGVVCHVGRAIAAGGSATAGLDNMRAALTHILGQMQRDQRSCRLILETACGAGSELLADVGSLVAFYDSFPKAMRRWFRLCVDTAHVWAAGEDPARQLALHFGRRRDGALALIHFNNTPVRRGARADRHACLLDPKGQLPRNTVLSIARWAQRHRVPLMLETHGACYITEIPWLRQRMAAG